MTQLLEKISLSFLSQHTNTQYALEKTSRVMVNKIIKNSNGIYSVIGEIKDIHITQTKQVLILADWADDHQLESTGNYFSYLDDNKIASLTKGNTYYMDNKKLINTEIISDFKLKKNKESYTSNVDKHEIETLIDATYSIFFGTHSLFFVNEKTYSLYIQADIIVKNLNSIIRTYPIYENIMYPNNETHELTRHHIIDLISKLPQDKTDYYLNLIAYSTSDVKTMKKILDKIISEYKCDPIYGKNLRTQEEQIEAFISFSKTRNVYENEIVPDTRIQELKDSEEYHKVLDDLKSHNFGISETQQFNVLQQVGLMTSSFPNKHIYNLSDMGAGKTLMTVEAIYMMDLQMIFDFEKSSTYNVIKNGNSTLRLPNKTIIAPLLSIESSWIDTFKLFYNVTKDSKKSNVYHLSYHHNGIEYISEINTAGFTVTKTSISVTPVEPEYEKSYLIIDEIHQIISRPLKLSKFITSTNSITNYYTFILSGTLSNLTTRQWYNMIMLLELPISIFDTDKTPSEYSHMISQNNEKLNISITDAISDLEYKDLMLDNSYVLSCKAHSTYKTGPATGIPKTNKEG